MLNNGGANSVIYSPEVFHVPNYITCRIEFGLSNWLGRQDYKILPVFYPAGHSPALIQKPPRMFKIVANDFS